MATYQVRIDADGEKVLSEPLSGLEGGIATEESPGVVRPDGVTTRVDNTGVLSAIGGNLLLNDEIWITESGTFTAPVTGWYDLWMIGGGDGVQNTPGVAIRGGNSGSVYSGVIFLHEGQEVPVIIGSGGSLTEVTELYPPTGAYIGGATVFGEFTTTGTHKFLPGTWYADAWEGGKALRAFGGGYGGDVDQRMPPSWYGAGGGGFSRWEGETLLDSYITSGYQGAIRLRFYDPAKAAGPVE